MSDNETILAWQGGTENYQQDKLTGLANMTHFMEEASKLLQKEANSGRVAFVFFNMDNFKSFNQKYGFQNGNYFLKGVADLIREAFPERLAARLNDDHFAVMDYKEGLEHRVRRVLDGIHDLRRNINIELKAGIYIPDSSIYNVALVMDRAKMACDSIKRVYDKNLRYYDWSLEQAIKLRNHIVSDFRSALANGYIEVFYQPEIRTLTKEICGYEALARWNDPVYGMLNPGVFIEVLEDVHLIHLLDLYVIRQVCGHMKYVREAGMTPTGISVNLSRIDFQLADMFKEIEALRNEYEIPAKFLNIEITESALNSESDALREQIDRFRSAGYEVWMDDFGSGYSTLNNLKDYRFDVLKIDMSFLRDFDRKPQTRVILATIVDLAKELGMHTLAEGVETKEQYEFLRAIGCEKIQGYLFGRPEPFKDDIYNASQERTIEPPELAKYYDDIGKVNVLSNFPLKNSDRSYDAINELAFAIIEQHGERLSFVYVNQSFAKFLQGLGYASPEDSLKSLADNYKAKGRHFLMDFLRQCRNSDDEETIDCVVESNLCNFRARCVSKRADGIAAFAVTAENLSKYKPLQKLENLDSSLKNILNIYSRIDVFCEDGTFETVYLDTTQTQYSGLDFAEENAVVFYANKYIAADEREAFIRFYDFNTAETRAKSARKDHVTSFFHSRTESEEYALQMYILIPFRDREKRMLLSCVRDIDGIDALEEKNLAALTKIIADKSA